MTWPFDQPPNCAVLTARSVMRGEESIVRVTHDEEDHGWQFLGSSGANMDDAMIVALEEVVKLDPSVLDVADIPPGWRAERSSSTQQWVRVRNKHSE